MKWYIRWLCIILLVFVEFMSCIQANYFQPWGTILGCSAMFLMAFGLSANQSDWRWLAHLTTNKWRRKT